MRTAHDVVAAISRATARDRLLIAAYRGESMQPPGDQLAALVDVARALTDESIPYALIGGIAVGVHSGRARATDDIDIAVATTSPQEVLVRALTTSGFALRGKFEHSINFLHPSGERVQLAFDPTFDEMIDRAATIVVAGMPVRIVTKSDLIATKERAARDPARRPSKAGQDEVDLKLLRGDVPDDDEGW